VRPHGRVALVLGSFAVQVQIEVGQQRRKTIGGVELYLGAIPKREL
jgi:hypothetical protein